MLVKAIKTRLVRADEISVEDLLVESLENFARENHGNLVKILPENSIIAISSKVVALCENNVIPFRDKSEREKLVKRESELFVDPKFSPYSHHFTINKGTLIGSAGIDLSNSDGNWLFLPKDVFASADKIREFLHKKYQRKNLGIIITDSVSSPLRRGTKGEMIAWSGFEAVKNYVGSEDLFGHEFVMEMSGIGTSLAVAANVVMGEGAEQTPLAIISDADFIKFVPRNPTRAEIDVAFVPFDEDLFMPFLKLMPWQKGGDETSGN